MLLLNPNLIVWCCHLKPNSRSGRNIEDSRAPTIVDWLLALFLLCVDAWDEPVMTQASGWAGLFLGRTQPHVDMHAWIATVFYGFFILDLGLLPSGSKPSSVPTWTHMTGRRRVVVGRKWHKGIQGWIPHGGQIRRWGDWGRVLVGLV